MRAVILFSLVMVLSASLALAQAGSIGIYADPAGASCNVADAVSGLCSYYVVHVNTTGSTGVQFAAPAPACLAATHLSDGAVYDVNIGNSQTGIAIGYPSCIASPNHILTINFFCAGLTPPCCYYKVVADPTLPSGLIEGSDCDYNLTHPTGGEAIVNATPDCECDVATQETTWGKVKSLYNK